MIAEIEISEPDVKSGTLNLLSSQALLAIRYMYFITFVIEIVYKSRAMQCDHTTCNILSLHHFLKFLSCVLFPDGLLSSCHIPKQAIIFIN